MRPRGKRLLLVALVGAACSSLASTADTDGSDSSCHPLVPEPWCFVWITDAPCQRGGEDGRRIYRVASNGLASDDGSFTVTERWYWFRGDPTRPDQDVVDTIEYEGRRSERWSGADLGCGQCEVVVDAQIRVVENPSGWTYQDQLDNVFAFDNLDPNSGFFEDYGMIVTRATLNPRGEPVVHWPDYARGAWRPDSDMPGQLPAQLDWHTTDPLGECY